MSQATIQRIDKLEPIEGAERIERATVLGWGVVVKKGEFAAGDNCVFVEIDAVLPEGPEWSEFMRPRNFRVKTVKLRGCLSQGLVLPMSVLPRVPKGVDVYAVPVTAEKCVGWEVSALLGIKHYEKPEAGGAIGGMSAGPFPPIPKTDEVRLQSAPGLLDELRDKAFYVTVKIDGTSGTFARMHTAFGPYKQGDLVVCTRTRSIHRPEKPGNAFWSVADKYRLAEMLPEGYAIQAEVAGPKIQRNRLELAEHDMFVFNVFDLRVGRYLDFQEMKLFCLDHGLKVVPWVAMFEPRAPDAEGRCWYTPQPADDGRTHRLRPLLDDFLQLAEGLYPGTKNRREGIVARPLVEMRSETLGGGRFSFKVVSNTYLLKDEE
jgi:RNA ligase (TIGR02306 family)